MMVISQKLSENIRYAGLKDIALTDSRPNGFGVRCRDGQGELKVVFLALNMGQGKQKAAVVASAKPTP
jgi:hypothetical protein